MYLKNPSRSQETEFYQEKAKEVNRRMFDKNKNKIK